MEDLHNVNCVVMVRFTEVHAWSPKTNFNLSNHMMMHADRFKTAITTKVITTMTMTTMVDS